MVDLKAKPFNLDDKRKDCEVIVDGNITTAKFYLTDSFMCLKSDEGDKYLEELSKRDKNGRFDITLDFDSFEPLYPDGKETPENIEISSKTNYKIIPVGANWTDNRNIVGFHNVITNKYQETPAYELIIQAQDISEPHFLILDEMNLSHVERYFADFLSAIESREKIPLYGNDPLCLPTNLFIIGTVNVDETTYMFSPKVLDRANVLEFETYSASDYMNNMIDIGSPSENISYLENPLSDREIRKYGINNLRNTFEGVKVDGKPFWDILSSEIDLFQNILKMSGFDFGFRVINEIVRFMVVSWKYEGEPLEFTNWARYFDACIKQKMLPKLHGSQKIIEETLYLLLKACLDDFDITKIDSKSIKFDINSIEITKDTAKYYTSAKKLEEMINILNKQRYVSFIN